MRCLRDCQAEVQVSARRHRTPLWRSYRRPVSGHSSFRRPRCCLHLANATHLHKVAVWRLLPPRRQLEYLERSLPEPVYSPLPPTVAALDQAVRLQHAGCLAQSAAPNADSAAHDVPRHRLGICCSLTARNARRALLRPLRCHAIPSLSRMREGTHVPRLNFEARLAPLRKKRRVLLTDIM